MKKNRYPLRLFLYTPKNYANCLHLEFDYSTDHHTDIIWPQHDRQNTLPKSQLEKSYGKKPSGKPRKCREAVLLNFDIFHNQYYIIKIFSLYYNIKPTLSEVSQKKFIPTTHIKNSP